MVETLMFPWSKSKLSAGIERMPEELAQDIGATKAEIELLYQEGVFKMKNIKDYKYSKAWVPSDTRLEK